MNAKTFTVGGFSTTAGVRRIRVANSMRRVAVLKNCGDTDIELRELPYPMTREQATEYLTTGFVAAAVLPKLTFEAALAQVPVRNAKGHFIKKDQREAMARELMA